MLAPSKFITVPTGIKIRGFGNPELELQIRPRSGLLFSHGITTFLGTVDNDYRGEVKVCLFNLSEKDYLIEPYERIAQAVLIEIAPRVYKELAPLPEPVTDTERGENGFGSSGKQ
jgi:dUTP pyrophosphatase